MKKTALILLLLLLPGLAFAAGTVAESRGFYKRGDIVEVVLLCTGDGSDGSIPDTTISEDVIGYYLYEVKIVPGGTGPTDNADLYIKDANSQDLLQGQGVNEVDNATSSHFQPLFYSMVNSALTLDVDNNSVNSSTYTIYLFFAK